MSSIVIQRITKLLPRNLRPFAKRLYYWGRHPIHPKMKRFGTVQDLYYWVADGELDTVLLLQNYFSAFFPNLDTETSGIVSLFDNNGKPLATKKFSVGHSGSTKLRVSELLQECQGHDDYGSLEVNISIPVGILDHIHAQEGLYFWDRFYIGYSNNQGQVCFVHGIDRTHIYHQGASDPIDWYEAPQNYEWAPEMPVDIENYEKFSVIMLNRTSRPADITLTLSDQNDDHLDWQTEIPPKGVRRFVLSGNDTSSLAPSELRMNIKGMPTQYGRPMVFKEFQNGVISVMHC